MADLAGHETTAHAPPQTPDAQSAHSGRLTFGRGLEDLGVMSFTPFLMLCAVIVVTPLGGYALVSAAIGVILGVIGAHLVMRRPHVVLPNTARNFIHTNQTAQSVIRFILHASENPDERHRKPAHWMTHEPFDLLPRAMIIVCGVALIYSWSIPYMSQALGMAVFLLSLSLHLRTPITTILGAVLISFASILPLFTG